MLARERLSRSELANRTPGLWKYFELLPISDRSNMVSLGEGGTYLQQSERLADDIGLNDFYLKDETTNPTGSFIDRGTAVEVSIAKEQGFRTVSCGSTGNLAASLVAYAARAGLDSKVFIAQRGNVDVGKFYQILAYGAEVEVVRNRDEAVARTKGDDQRTHTVMPYNLHFLEGVKTTVYETCEQLDWATPDWIIAPMGNGGHISMIWKGIKELQQIGLIEGDLPRLVGAQAQGCAPIVEAFEKDITDVAPATSVSTIAIDIGVRAPSCGAMSLRRLVSSGVISRTDTVVCMITGTGLKYPEIAKIFVKGKPELEQLLSRFEGRKYTTRLGTTKLHILQILSKQESYGYGIWKKLEEDFGLNLKIPSVYQHLSELASSGLIVKTRSEQTIQKTHRYYYDLSDRGRQTLTQLKKLDT
jgi:threonine synthase